jgi:hypothetical protein
MNTAKTKLLTILIPGIISLNAAACGGMDQAGTFDEAEAAELQDDGIELDSLEAELNGSDACKFASPDVTYNFSLPPTVSGNIPKLAEGGYQAGQNGCGAARFFDINDMKTGSTAGTFRIEYLAGAAAVNCTDRRLMVYAWHKNGTDFKNLNKTGVVTVQPDGQAYCRLQTNITELGLTPDNVKDYHFAVSHRENHADGSYTTLPIYGYGTVVIIA